MGIMPDPGNRTLRQKKGEMPLRCQSVTVGCVSSRREQYKKGKVGTMADWRASTSYKANETAVSRCLHEESKLWTFLEKVGVCTVSERPD